jgi:MFS family permease
MTAGLRLFLCVAFATGLSQFHRVSLGVLAPEMSHEMDLTPELVGVAGGAFFLALGLLQIPVGVLFDRFGPRRVVVTLMLLGVLGAIAQAEARDGWAVILARFMIGAGLAGNFMAAVVLVGRWWGGARYATTLSRVFAVSQVGTLCASTPLALLVALIGWREALWVSAGLTALSAFLVHLGVRDWPPGSTAPVRVTESLGALLKGVVEIWRIPGVLKIAGMHAVAYANMVTVLGLWAGPYLRDVHGLDAVERSHVLLTMSVAQILGILAYGPLDRRFNTRKGVVLVAGLVNLSVLLALAAIPAPPVWLAIALLIALCLVAAYGIVIVAHGRAQFPERLVGRGVTSMNMAQISGATLMPVLTGWAIGLFPATATGARPEEAYRLAYLVLAACLAAGIAVYSRSKDAKPSG